MTATHSVTDTLNSLLRGELAAYETYRQALAHKADPLIAAPLSQICREHLLAVEHLRLHVRRFGGTPEADSGLWGSFAHAVEGAATLMGNVAALVALREGERHGLMTYLEAMHDPTLPSECQNLVRDVLVPDTETHIAALDQLVELAD